MEKLANFFVVGGASELIMKRDLGEYVKTVVLLKSCRGTFSAPEPMTI